MFCGRYVNEHMVTHGVMSEHPMVLSFSDLSVWCYMCEAYVHNQVRLHCCLLVPPSRQQLITALLWALEPKQRHVRTLLVWATNGFSNYFNRSIFKENGFSL